MALEIGPYRVKPWGGINMAGAAAAAAAQEQKRKHEEEEQLTDYRPADLEGWEFKIVRSAGKIVGDRFQQLLAEEAENGWELVEKFDDYRIRFKRRIEERGKYPGGTVDPYRTTFGLTDSRLAVIIVLASLGIFGVIMLAIILLANS